MVTTQVASRDGRLPELMNWRRPIPSGRRIDHAVPRIKPKKESVFFIRCHDQHHDVLGTGTKGLPRNTRCRASRALRPFFLAVET